MVSIARATIPVIVALVTPVAGLAQSTLPPPPQLPPVGSTPSQAAPPESNPQAQSSTPSQAPPPGPYTSIPVASAGPVTDPSFPAFRKTLGAIVRRKDRTALQRLVAPKFFWLTEAGDQTEKDESAFDSFAAATDLDSSDGSGWEFLAAAAAEDTLQPFSERPGAFCAPAGPIFDYQAFGQLLKSTGTQVAEWAYTLNPNVPVRTSSSANSAAVETVGRILVRVMPEVAQSGKGKQQAEANALFVMTPSGKTGWIAYDDVWRLSFDQLCYTKDADGWKIAGFLSGKD